MRKIVYLLLTITVLTGCKMSSVSEADSLKLANQIDTLIAHKEFFEARELFSANLDKLTQFHGLKAGAIIYTVFNKPDSSNQNINLLFKNFDDRLSDSIRFDLLSLQQNNYVRLFDYNEAYNSINEMLVNYSQFMSNDEREDYSNTRIIWKSLVNQPKQIVTKNDYTKMRIIRDKVGLANLRVNDGNDSIDFIFDTGANFSTATESVAGKLNMVIMDSLFDVTSITGSKVKSRVAVCPEINIGNIKIANVVFLIFPDSMLNIPQIQYQINGIIGFPVMEAMREIQITRDGEFIIPQQTGNYQLQNMALDFLTPVININGESYTFDTGATSTMLYEKYFLKHKSDIENNYKETDLKIGGAGSAITKKGYEITFQPVLNGENISMDSISVFKENLAEDHEYFYGNIGQDLIKNFKSIAINFESMFIRFDK